MVLELREKATELRAYAQLEGSELGELCQSRINLTYHAEYASEEFISALDKELTAQLTYFQENTTIVEREETITNRVCS